MFCDCLIVCEYYMSVNMCVIEIYLEVFWIYLDSIYLCVHVYYVYCVKKKRKKEEKKEEKQFLISILTYKFIITIFYFKKKQIFLHLEIEKFHACFEKD